MPAADHKLTTREMANFVVNGYLRFESIIPQEINEAIISELKPLSKLKFEQVKASLGAGASQYQPEAIDYPETLSPLSACYPRPSIIGKMLRLPQVQGLIHSLVGADPLFDHDFVHFIKANNPRSQHLHVDAVIDDRHPSFDIQLFYYPYPVAENAGGTRFVPGSHLRHTRAEGVARYQKVLGEQQYSGPAGTLVVFHQGLWHAGQPNPSNDDRWMYKIRLNPQVPQKRLWNTDDFAEVHNDPRDHTFAHMRQDSVAHYFRKPLPWQQGHELRYEQMERARLWRYLSDDDSFDVDYYHTRIEGRSRVNQELSQ